jgi:phenylacetate-CoA ligase
MTEHYDELETRDPEARERDLFDQLPKLLTLAIAESPGWTRRLEGIGPEGVTSREALARLPLLRKSDLTALQQAGPPFGGLAAVAPEKLKRLLVSPGPIFEPEGHGRDWWGAARALFAAGFRPGDIAINCFSYHLTPGGHILESGAHALGCAVIPGGVGNTEQQIDAIAHLRPVGYLGTPDFLKILLDEAEKLGCDSSSIVKGLVSGAAFPPSLQSELLSRGVNAYQAYATAELGVVAYESEGRQGLVVNEGRIVEIVRPGTGDPVPVGEVGEVVVTNLNFEYPMIRLATGDLSAIMEGQSPCGRSNLRISGWMGRADQTTKVKGMFVHPAQIAEIGGRHPELKRLRLVVSREGEQDVMVLRAEVAGAKNIAKRVSETLVAVTRLKGRVELVPLGTLPNDGKVISDERT